jgi:cyclophilin family peptidyl-prolyl cis-trans isomerase
MRKDGRADRMKKERKKEKREKKEKNVQWWNDHKKQILFALFIVAIFGLSILTFQNFGGVNVKNSGGENVKNRSAIIETSKGTIEVLLYEDQAPITCANFIKIAQTGFYNGLIFHRVIAGFVIQGGGFKPGLVEAGEQLTPIRLEIIPGLKHLDGAIAMARTNDPNSATSQFYICDGAQPRLDGSYAVFGIVTKGMEVVRAIASAQTHTVGQFSGVPVEDVVIISITIVSG